MMIRPGRWLLALVLVGLAGGTAYACPTCAESMRGEGVEGMLQGIFWTAMFMFSFPFVIVGAIVMAVRKAWAGEAARSQDPATPGADLPASEAGAARTTRG